MMPCENQHRAASHAQLYLRAVNTAAPSQPSVTNSPFTALGKASYNVFHIECWSLKSSFGEIFQVKSCRYKNIERNVKSCACKYIYFIAFIFAAKDGDLYTWRHRTRLTWRGLKCTRFEEMRAGASQTLEMDPSLHFQLTASIGFWETTEPEVLSCLHFSAIGGGERVQRALDVQTEDLV